MGFVRSKYYVASNAKIGFQIISVTFTDEDIGVNAEVTFILVKGGDNKLAIHSNNGSIYVIASIVNDTEFTLTVTAKDKGTPALSTDGVIVIVVEQPNDYTPVFSNLPNQTNIVENSAVSSLLFTAIASDGDSSDTLEGQFSFSVPTSSPYISINSSTGKITLEKPFDREEQKTLNFEARQHWCVCGFGYKGR